MGLGIGRCRSGGHFRKRITMEQIRPEEFAKHWKPGREEIVFLDCRQPEELAIASIAGALHIPMGEIPERLGEIDRKKQIVVFCHHGMRSMRVAAFLEQQGFPNVANLIGGIDAWSDRVDAKVPKY